MRLAAQGLSGKLLLSNIPEMAALHDSLELLRNACGGDALAVSRAWLVLRGVRGLHGVGWVAQWLCRCPERLGGAWAAAWPAQLLADLDARSLQHHGGAATWACHNEGRHAGLSGRHFLAAFAEPEGFQSVSAVALRVRPFMQKLLDRDSDLTSDFLVDVVEAVQGALVLATQPVRCAGAYNAMDFARGLGAWALRSGRVASADVSERVWQCMVARQHRHPGGAFDACQHFGLGTAHAANGFLRVLREKVRPLGVGAQEEVVCWIGLLAYLCETRQALSHPLIGRAGLERLLSAPVSDYLGVALAQQQGLRQRGTLGKECYAVSLYRAALSALPC